MLGRAVPCAHSGARAAPTSGCHHAQREASELATKREKGDREMLMGHFWKWYTLLSRGQNEMAGLQLNAKGTGSIAHRCAREAKGIGVRGHSTLPQD